MQSELNRPAMLAAARGSATLLQQLKWNLWWRGPIHGAICWYLRRCSGAFHHNPYGPDGRYAVLMNEEQYHRYGKVRQSPNAAGELRPPGQKP
jgi:hypothetical protein